MASNGGYNRNTVYRKNERYTAWRAEKSVLSNRGLGINATKCPHEGATVPTEADAWGMRSAELV